MEKTIRYISLVVVMLLSLAPFESRAQYNFDVMSVDALINDHKATGSRLLVRSSVEHINEVLHDSTKNAIVMFDSLNVDLDKYTKCFDIIDVLVQGGSLIANTVKTITYSSSKISDITGLLSDFVTECTLQGDIYSSDTLIISTCRRCIDRIKKDIRDIETSISVDLVPYCTGLKEMSTSDLLITITRMNDALDDIRKSLDSTYYILCRYITIRKYCFFPRIFQARNLGQICDDAFQRWIQQAAAVSGISR